MIQCHDSAVSVTPLNQNSAVSLTQLSRRRYRWVNFVIFKGSHFLSNQIQAKVNLTTQGLWCNSLKIGVACRKFVDFEVSLTPLSRLWIRISLQIRSFMWEHCRVWTSGQGEDVWLKNRGKKSRETVPLNKTYVSLLTSVIIAERYR
jgi:hypothetical protein